MTLQLSSDLHTHAMLCHTIYTCGKEYINLQAEEGAQDLKQRYEDQRVDPTPTYKLGMVALSVIPGLVRQDGRQRKEKSGILMG